jgi:hypothetical protein
MLASFVLLLGDRVRLLRVWLSALALGVAIWSKEIAVTAIPAFAVLAARQAPRHSRLMALVSWPLVCLSVVSVYPLMALLKGELFPSGSLLGGTNPHVSLLCSLEWQSARGADGGILNPGSAFWTTFGSWAAKDPVLVLGGSAAALVSVAVFRRHRGLSMLGWSVLTFWAFLGRGGVILDFYLVPLLPFLAIGLAAAAWRLAGLLLQARWSTAGPRVTAAALAVVTILSVGGQTVQLAQPANAAMWTADPAKGQREAIDWVEQHLPSGSRIVLDMYMWVDLHDRADGGRPFTHAEYYWKAATDPAVKQGEFEGDWRNVDYVITTPQLTQDTAAQGWGIIQQALNHSRPVAHFNTGLDVTVRHVSPDYSAGGFTWKQPQKSAVAPSCMQGP